MLVPTPRLIIRPLTASDARTLAEEANDPRIARHLRDGFPSPFGVRDARRFILSAEPLEALAITRDDSVIGGIGLIRGHDVYRLTGEVGYWLGTAHWGQGYATEAVDAFTRWVFAHTDLERLFGGVFSGNPASARVLEKCGYRRESVQRRAVVKSGVIRDLEIWVRLRGDGGA